MSEPFEADLDCFVFMQLYPITKSRFVVSMDGKLNENTHNIPTFPTMPRNKPSGRELAVGRSNMKMTMFRARKRIRAHILEAMQAGECEVVLDAPVQAARKGA